VEQPLREDVHKAAAVRRREPAYLFWSVLSGKAPPVPHREADPDGGLTTLYDAHALFEGLRRPIGQDGDGARFLAYILKPTHFYAYHARLPLMVTEKEAVPADLVFAAYVRLDEPADKGDFLGVLTHWHFIGADPRDPMLPEGYENRYLRRLW
jgi:hypothetical protein